MRSLLFILLSLFLWVVYALAKKTLSELLQESPRTGSQEEGHSHSGGQARRPGQQTEEYYRQILQLNEPITAESLRRQYRQLMAQYHPDKVQHLGREFQEMAEQRTKELNEAYEYFRKKYRL